MLVYFVDLNVLDAIFMKGHMLYTGCKIANERSMNDVYSEIFKS